ncbi:MAG: hypothetical protein WDW38_007753 [Sanguina aurantia]
MLTHVPLQTSQPTFSKPTLAIPSLTLAPITITSLTQPTLAFAPIAITTCDSIKPLPPIPKSSKPLPPRLRPQGEHGATIAITSP